MALSLGVKVKASAPAGTTALLTGAITTINQRTIVLISTGGSATIGQPSGTIGGSPDGNIYTEILTAQSNTAKMRMWVCENANGGASHVFTFPYTGGSEFPTVFAFQIATAAGFYAALDGPSVAAQANDSTQPYTVTSGSTTVADTFVVGAIAASFASTANGGIVGTFNGVAGTVGDTDVNAAQIWPGGWIYKIQTAQAAQALSMTVGTQPANESTVIKVAAFKEVAAGAGAALTGQAGTGASGSLVPTIALALIGVAATAAIGTLAPPGGSPLVGQAATSSIGVAVPTITKQLTGVSATGSVGTFGGGAGGGLGAHTLHGVLDGDGSGTETTSPIVTQSSGSSYVWFEGGYTSNNQKPTDNKSNSTTVTGTPRAYNGFSGAFNFKYWVVENGNGGSGHTLSCVLNGQPAGEVVLGLIEAKGATALTDSSEDYPSSGNPNTSTPVTVSGPATLIAIWTGDNPGTTNTATPGDGFSTIEDYTVWPPGETSVQTVVAAKEVTSAGSYGITWTATPTQGAILTLLAFEHAPSQGAENVSYALSGVAGTGAAGTVSIPGTALTGIQATGAAGLPAAGVSYPLVGVQAVGAHGSIAAVSAVPMTGAGAAGAAGILASPGGTSLVGQAATAAAGLATPEITLALAGVAATGSAGLAVPASAPTLSGAQAAGLAGTLQATGDREIQLSGVSGFGFAGILTSSEDAGLCCRSPGRTVFSIVKRNAIAAAALGAPDFVRLFPGGSVPQEIETLGKVYATYQTVGGLPANTMTTRAPADHEIIKIDVWSNDDDEADEVLGLIRDALDDEEEQIAHCCGIQPQSPFNDFESDTRLYRRSRNFSVWVKRC